MKSRIFLTCVAAIPRPCLNHLYSPPANQCTKTRSNILQSRKDICERFLWAGFLRVSYVPHDWPNSYVCVTAGRSDILKFTEGSWQGSFTMNNERAVRTWKHSSEEKKCFERIPSRPEIVCKFADQFSSVFLSLQMYCRVFRNLADSSNVKTNQENMIFSIQKKNKQTKTKNNYTHVAIQVQAFWRKPKKLRLFTRNKNSLRLKA